MYEFMSSLAWDRILLTWCDYGIYTATSGMAFQEVALVYFSRVFKKPLPHKNRKPTAFSVSHMAFELCQSRSVMKFE
jgi:hypothetical protein